MERKACKLVCVGDSLTQGFQNSCIYRTDLSYPAMLKQAMDYKAEFRQPLFTARGGIPVNVEMLVRSLEEQFGPDFTAKDFPLAMAYLFSTLKYVKNYWDGKVRSLQNPHQTTPYHNQSIWGLTINDAWMLTDNKARQFMKTNPVKYSVFNFLPDHAMYVTARCTLNPTGGSEFANYSMLDNIDWLDCNRGIENLIVYLGSNHIISSAGKLNITYSKDSEVEALPFEREYTVMKPEHFEYNFNKLADRINRLNPTNIITATIPYITLLPIMQPVYSKPQKLNQEYADYYTHFWINPDQFDPDKDPHLTREQAVELDLVVDQYNTVIRSVAHKYNWLVVPVNRLVYAASGRNSQKHQQPYSASFVEALKNNPKTNHLVSGDKINLTTDLPEADENGRLIKGGLISLDGIHPTTTAYGLFAELFMNVMKEKRIEFKGEINWDQILTEDELISNPPRILKPFRQIQFSLMQMFKNNYRNGSFQFGRKDILNRVDRALDYIRNQTKP